jgi:RNA polymerase sigma-70 factor (ECF subfamily)
MLDKPAEYRPSPSVSTMSDAELYLAMQRGHSSALGILFSRYGRLVQGVALKVLRNPQEAEDLTQEVFLSLWRNASKKIECRYFVSYLVILTRSRAIDRFRARKRYSEVLDNWSSNTQVAPAPKSPLELAVRNEHSQHLHTALSQLSDNQRQVIELAYYQGMSQSEIATTLDLPLGTVKTYTRQGFVKLRQILDPAISPSYE